MSIKNIIKSKISREFILYLAFGVGTTTVDFGVSFLLYRAGVNIHISDVVAWAFAVVFAYITNKVFVFRSKTKKITALFLEILGFFGSRALTLIMQELIVVLMYDILEINKYIVKISAAIVVIILNYIISKLVVFNKGGDKN